MRRFALRSVALSSAILVGAALAGTRPQYGGNLRVETHIVPTSLDPADSTQPESVARANMTALLFDTLIVLDAQGRSRPSLASSWQVEPGNQRWTFNLRPGAKFHDGSAVTPDAVAASLRVANPTWSVLASSGAVVIERDSPSPELPYELARSRNSIVKRDGVKIFGTGPFRVQSFTPGRHLTLVANEDSWAGRPYVDSVDIDFGRSGRDQLIALDAGRIDVAEVTPDQTSRAASMNRPTLSSAPIELFELSFLRDPTSTDDKTLRLALALSIDRASIRRVILQSSGESTAALLPNWISGYAFVFPSGQNLALARQKRAEAKTARTLSLAFDSSDPFVELVAERVILNAKDAGITMQTTTSATPDLRLIHIPLDTVTARVALTELTSQAGLPNPRLANVSADALYQAESAALQTQRMIPLFYVPARYALAPQVRDAKLSITGSPRLADVWIGAPAR